MSSIQKYITLLNSLICLKKQSILNKNNFKSFCIFNFLTPNSFFLLELIYHALFKKYFNFSERHNKNFNTSLFLNKTLTFSFNILNSRHDMLNFQHLSNRSKSRLFGKFLFCCISDLVAL